MAAGKRKGEQANIYILLNQYDTAIMDEMAYLHQQRPPPRTETERYTSETCLEAANTKAFLIGIGKSVEEKHAMHHAMHYTMHH